MVRVKICGLTNLEDARHAARCGADMLGFIFAESPRRVTVGKAREIIGALRGEGLGKPTMVGVFVNAHIGEVIDACFECGLDVVQLHGDEPPEYCRSLSHVGISVIKSFRIRDRSSTEEMFRYSTVDYFLCDTFDPEQAGGTGRPFDHSLVAGLSRSYQLILAGGLTPDNVAGAIAAVRPWGVDVSSGVEASPGRKDPAKVEAFIQNARSAPGDRPAQ